MEITKLIFTPFSNAGNQRSMTIKFNNGTIDMADALKWARSVARQWGDINSQTKVKVEGLPGPSWWFSCSGHGGYIMVAPGDAVPDTLKRFAVDGFLAWDEKYADEFKQVYKNITVFRFEEDCDWAVLEHIYPQVARWSVIDREKGWAHNPDLDADRAKKARQRLDTPEELDRLTKRRIEAAKHTIKRWHPEILKA